MALEIAPLIHRSAIVLDVGCGNGFIAHHLAGLLGCKVTGIDLIEQPVAMIPYSPYDGRRFPIMDQSIDAILLCYVLHHTQELSTILNEVRRVLRSDGTAIIYEDIPRIGWDRVMCWAHNLQWKRRTGPCAFRSEAEWQKAFREAGFELLHKRRLSRCRNFGHPVSRSIFVLKNSLVDERRCQQTSRPEVRLGSVVYGNV